MFFLAGNEGYGIDASILDLCDVLLSIQPRSVQPHGVQPRGVDRQPTVGSLNVSVATGTNHLAAWSSQTAHFA